MPAEFTAMNIYMCVYLSYDPTKVRVLDYIMQCCSNEASKITLTSY